MASHDYLKKTLTARVYDVARETELERAPNLSARLRNPIYLKREDNQPVFSFKLRGAYNKMVNLPADALERGIITASAGNHAQGVALSAARLGVKAIIVVPVTTPQVKVDAVRAHGGPTVEVVQFGESFSDAYGHATQLQEERGLTFVHPFDDPYVIAGQGTVAMEILRQHQGPLHAIFVPIGGGGLAAGVAAYVKAVRPEIKVIGVQTEDSCAMAESLKAKKRVTLNEVGLFSDGTAVKLVGEETFRLCSEYLDDVLVVNTDALCAAIKDVFQDTRSVLEPAGALAVAGAKQYAEREGIEGQTLVAITSGANMNFDRMRFVAERAEVGEAREAVFAVTIPEERGSFRRFCELVGTRSVTEFNYRIADASSAHIFVGVQIRNRGHMEKAAAPTILDKQRVLLEYMRVGFVNPQDFLDELGRPIPVKDLPRSVAAAISQIEVEEIQRRDDETGELESVSIKTKLKLHPKLPALEVLAKHVGLIGDNPGVTVNVNGDGDVHVHSDRELALAIIAQLQKGLAEQPAPKTVQGSAKHG